jgi:hypothetical protein
MKKRNPSSGQNGQLVHWWLLIHSGRPDFFGFESVSICITLRMLSLCEAQFQF